MRISDWSSDVCSSDLPTNPLLKLVDLEAVATFARKRGILAACDNTFATPWVQRPLELGFDVGSEEHTSELQSLMRISYAVFCLKKKKLYHEEQIAQAHIHHTITN